MFINAFTTRIGQYMVRTTRACVLGTSIGTHLMARFASNRDCQFIVIYILSSLFLAVGKAFLDAYELDNSGKSNPNIKNHDFNKCTY